MGESATEGWTPGTLRRNLVRPPGLRLPALLLDRSERDLVLGDLQQVAGPVPLRVVGGRPELHRLGLGCGGLPGRGLRVCSLLFGPGQLCAAHGGLGFVHEMDVQEGDLYRLVVINRLLQTLVTDT